MTVKHQGIGIIPDNEATYYNYLKGYIESIDPYAVLFINRAVIKVSFRLTPSSPDLLLVLLQGIKDIHNLFGIKVTFSKSIKKTLSISFDITM